MYDSNGVSLLQGRRTFPGGAGKRQSPERAALAFFGPDSAAAHFERNGSQAFDLAFTCPRQHTSDAAWPTKCAIKSAVVPSSYCRKGSIGARPPTATSTISSFVSTHETLSRPLRSGPGAKLTPWLRCDDPALWDLAQVLGTEERGRLSQRPVVLE